MLTPKLRLSEATQWQTSNILAFWCSQTSRISDEIKCLSWAIWMQLKCQKSSLSGVTKRTKSRFSCAIQMTKLSRSDATQMLKFEPFNGLIPKDYFHANQKYFMLPKCPNSILSSAIQIFKFEPFRCKSSPDVKWSNLSTFWRVLSFFETCFESKEMF